MAEILHKYKQRPTFDVHVLCLCTLSMVKETSIFIPPPLCYVEI
jgi:hypothetical protein